MKIEKLILYTSHFNEQWRFYDEILGLPCHRISENTFRVSTLFTQLEFHKSSLEQYYHFAFLIPTGTINDAISYLESKGISLLLLEGEKVVNFNPGKAIYFKDLDGNIVEWIERPSVAEASGLKFQPGNLICVNEIGFPVANPRQVARTLMHNYGIDPQSPDGFSDEFCWVGDARGVMIVVKKGRHWLPTEIPSVPNQFKIQYRSNNREYNLVINGDEINPAEDKPEN